MRKKFLNGDFTEKEVTLVIRVPSDFDREDERMLDDAFAHLLYENGYELVDSKEYVNITEEKPSLTDATQSASFRPTENTEIINEDDLRLFISDYRGENYLNLSDGDMAQISEDNDCFKHIYESVKEYLEDEGVSFDDVDVSHYSPDENRFVLLDLVSNSFQEYKQCPVLYRNEVKPGLDSVIDNATEKRNNNNPQELPVTHLHIERG